MIAIVSLGFWLSDTGPSQKEYLELQNQSNNLQTELHQLQNDNQEFLKRIEERNAEIDRLQTEAKANEAKTKIQPKNPVAPKNNSQSAQVEQWRPLVAKYDWPVEQALGVMNGESGGNPRAISRTQDRGLMQINQVHKARVNGNLDQLFDPETNIKVAYAIYVDNGRSWCPWVAAQKMGYCKR